MANNGRTYGQQYCDRDGERGPAALGELVEKGPDRADTFTAQLFALSPQAALRGFATDTPIRE
ncbi:hypothetical protein D3C85_1808340 [compost metagenome]